jgi:hypothetical protein
MAFQFTFTPRIEKDFRKERLFYVPPDPKVFEIHIEQAGKKRRFILGYANNLLEEVRELFTPKRNDKVFSELREYLGEQGTKIHLVFYFFNAPSDYRKPVEMAAGKWLKWRRDSSDFVHAVDDDDLDVLGANRPFEIEFEGDTADVELYK